MFRNTEYMFQIKEIKTYIYKWRTEVVLLFGFFTGAFLAWPAVEIAIFLIFLWGVSKSVPSRFFVLPAFSLLAVGPIFLILKNPERAEEFSVYAYYFLVIALVLALREVWKENNLDG